MCERSVCGRGCLQSKPLREGQRGRAVHVHGLCSPACHLQALKLQPALLALSSLMITDRTSLTSPKSDLATWRKMLMRSSSEQFEICQILPVRSREVGIGRGGGNDGEEQFGGGEGRRGERRRDR